MKSDYSVILSSLRRERGLSQRKVAQDLGISQALLSHYENGVREPRFEFVVRVCGYYGVSADYFLGRTDEKSYDDKVVLPCPCPPLRNSLSISAVVSSVISETCDNELARAAAGYLDAFARGMLRHMREPYAPADPSSDAALKTAEAEFLASVRRLSESGELPELTPDSLHKRYPSLYISSDDRVGTN